MCTHCITVMGREDYEVLIILHECFMTQSIHAVCKKIWPDYVSVYASDLPVEWVWKVL